MKIFIFHFGEEFSRQAWGLFFYFEGRRLMKHGGNLSKLRDLYDLDQDLVDFSANINPLGLAHEFKEIIISSLDDLEVYPDFDYEALKKALGEKLLV